MAVTSVVVPLAETETLARPVQAAPGPKAVIHRSNSTGLTSQDCIEGVSPDIITDDNATLFTCVAGYYAEVPTGHKQDSVSATDKVLGRSSSGAGAIEEIDCTAAGRAILDDATAAAQRTTLGAAYTIPVQALTGGMSANTTYYFGMLPLTAVAAVDGNKVYIRRAGVIRVAELYVLNSGTLASNEAWSIYVRLNNTTDTLIATVSTSAKERIFSNAAIDIAVASGDYFEIKVVCPAWATAPTAVRIGGYLLVE
jgi:hypothetical protein